MRSSPCDSSAMDSAHPCARVLWVSELVSHAFVFSLQASGLNGDDDREGERTRDGSVDMHGRPAMRDRTGKWFAGMIILRKYLLFLCRPAGRPASIVSSLISWLALMKSL